MEVPAPTNVEIVAELRRVTVLFQARALATVMGFPLPTSLPANTSTLEREGGGRDG